jgi:transaldolase
VQPTHQLHEAGQSLWLDSISRELLARGRLRRYIEELSVTGLTSNPTIFDHAIEHSSDYDEDIRKGVEKGLSPEEVFFELALADLRGIQRRVQAGQDPVVSSVTSLFVSC